MGCDMGTTDLCVTSPADRVQVLKSGSHTPRAAPGSCWSQWCVVCKGSRGRRQVKMENGRHRIFWKYTVMFTEEEGMIQKETGGGVHMHSTEEEDVEGDPLKAFSISVAFMGSGEFNRKSQKCLSCKLIYGSCRNRNKRIDHFTLCTRVYTHHNPHTWTSELSCHSAWMEISSLWLLTRDLSAQLSYWVPHIQPQCGFMRQSTQI